MAIIGLENMKFHALHGYYDEEEIVGGEFEVDAFVEVDVEDAAEDDELGETVNYETIHFICQSEMRKTQKLIETVAYNIMERLNHQFEGKVSGIRVKVKKIAPPLDGRVGCASIELTQGTLDPQMQMASVLKLLL